MTAPKFDVEVQLTGQDGNAYAIMGAVQRGLRKVGATPEEIKQYQTESMSGDYDNLLVTAMNWVHVA